jgi:hypothetical protein
MQWLDQVKAVRVESGSAQPSAYRMLASTTALTGGEITIIASRYAIDLPLHVDSIAHFLRDPGARASSWVRKRPGKKPLISPRRPRWSHDPWRWICSCRG